MLFNVSLFSLILTINNINANSFRENYNNVFSSTNFNIKCPSDFTNHVSNFTTNSSGNLFYLFGTNNNCGTAYDGMIISQDSSTAILMKGFGGINAMAGHMVTTLNNNNIVGNTVLNYRVKNVPNVGGNEMGMITFYENTSYNGCVLGLQTGTNNQGTIVTQCQNICKMYPQATLASGYTAVKVNFSEISSNCSITYTKLANIKYIGTTTNSYDFGGTFYRFAVDELNLTNLVTIANNTLPNITYKLNTSLPACYNSSNGVINQDINFILNGTDKENDTIMYATTINNVFSNNSFYLTDFSYLQQDNNGNLFRYPDYGFFSTPNFISNYTFTETNLFNDLFRDTHKFHIIADSSSATQFNTNYQLVWYSQLDSWEFKTTYILANDVKFVLKYNFPLNNTYLENIYLDSSGYKILNISYNLTEFGNLTVKANGVLLNAYVNNNRDFASIFLFNKSINRMEYYLICNTGICANYSTTLTANDFNYVMFNTFDTTPFSENRVREFDLKYITYDGLGLQFFPNFTSVKPNHITVNQTGINVLQIYYTDLPHVGLNQYNTFKTNIFIPECSNYVNPNNILPSLNNVGDATKKINLKICTATNNFIYKFSKNSITNQDIDFCILQMWLVFIGSILLAGFIIIGLNFVALLPLDLEFAFFTALQLLFIVIANKFIIIDIGFNIASVFIFAIGFVIGLRYMFYPTQNTQ